MDRIDLHVYVPEVKVEKLVTQGASQSESSETIQKRVQKARDIQHKRFLHTDIQSNGEMSTKAVKQFCELSPQVLSFLRRAVSSMHLSARGYYRVLKVSRTIADLEKAEDITISHVAEALQFKPNQEN
jgi:magnesium chelatase family protein